MAKAKLKTEKTEVSVKDFLNTVDDEQKRKDILFILKLMEKAIGEKPKMWGATIIGFGNVNLKYESGRELDWFKIGLSPRKQNIALYGLLIPSLKEELLIGLGKHSTGKGCLYIKDLTGVNRAVLQNIIEQACDRKK